MKVKTSFKKNERSLSEVLSLKDINVLKERLEREKSAFQDKGEKDRKGLYKFVRMY